MKIKNITIWAADLDITRPYTIAFKTISTVQNAFVRITLANGITGWGSGNPSEYVTKESFANCLQVLQSPTVQQLVGKDIRHLYEITEWIAHTFPQNPAARAALDIAIYDAYCQWMGVRIVDFLGEKHYALPTSITIGIKNTAETLEEAKEYAERGFKVLKVKTGLQVAEDIDRLTRVRDAFPSMIIRVDANQGYSAEDTLRFFDEAKALQIELVEQPLPANDVVALRAFPDVIKSKIAADESLLSPFDAFSLAQHPRAAGIFNIKLMKCGGITPARYIADVAQYAGIELFWGCNDESIVSITAALHVAFASQATRYIDLDGSLDLAKDEVKQGFILEDGYMRLPSGAGLGLIH